MNIWEHSFFLTLHGMSKKTINHSVLPTIKQNLCFKCEIQLMLNCKAATVSLKSFIPFLDIPSVKASANKFRILQEYNI